MFEKKYSLMCKMNNNEPKITIPVTNEIFILMTIEADNAVKPTLKFNLKINTLPRIKY